MQQVNIKGIFKDRKKLVKYLIIGVFVVVFFLFFRKYKAKSDALSDLATQQAISQADEFAKNRDKEQQQALNSTLKDSEIQSKVDMLKQLMYGVTNASERQDIVDIMLGLKCKEDYQLLYDSFGTHQRRNLLEALKYNLKKSQYEEVVNHINKLSNE